MQFKEQGVYDVVLTAPGYQPRTVRVLVSPSTGKERAVVREKLKEVLRPALEGAGEDPERRRLPDRLLEAADERHDDAARGAAPLPASPRSRSVRKTSRGRAKTVTGPSWATTSAERGASSTRAISPTTSPGPRKASASSPTPGIRIETRSRPSATT